MTALAPVKLEQLSDRIRTEHVAVGHAARNMLAHAMAAGDALIEARQQIAPGGWENWVERECDLKVRTSERYVQLAKARARMEADPSRATGLSITGALRILGNKPRSVREGCESSSAVKAKLDPVAWSDASADERRRFLDAIGIGSVLKAMPPSWRSALEASLLEREVVPDPATTTEQTTAPGQDGLDIPEILRRELPPPSVSKTANTRLVDNAPSRKKVNTIAKAASLPAPQINPSPRSRCATICFATIGSFRPTNLKRAS